MFDIPKKPPLRVAFVQRVTRHKWVAPHCHIQ